MIRIELTTMPARRWVVTVEPEGLPWAGTTVVLTEAEMTELLREVSRVNEQKSEPE